MSTPDRLRELVQAATPGPWRYRDDGLILDAEQYHVLRVAGSPSNPELAASASLAAFSPELAAWAADAADFVRYYLGYDVVGWESHLSVGELNEKARVLLARLDGLLPEGGE